MLSSMAARDDPVARQRRRYAQVKYQPPTTNRATWVAEIKKMQHTFGAPIPDDQIAPLADYLAKNYGNEQGK